jgi:hypothetical protein
LGERAAARHKARPPIATKEQQAMANMRPFGLLAGADPFRELRRLQDEMNSLVGTSHPPPGRRWRAGSRP